VSHLLRQLLFGEIDGAVSAGIIPGSQPTFAAFPLGTENLGKQ